MFTGLRTRLISHFVGMTSKINDSIDSLRCAYAYLASERKKALTWSAFSR